VSILDPKNDHFVGYQIALPYRGVTTAGDTGDASRSPVRPTMSPLHQNDNRQFVFRADF